MFCIYILKSKKGESFYIGYTNDLKKRFMQHNNLENKSTKHKVPFELIYYEAYKSKSDDRYREKNLKRFANAYNQLKKRIHNSLS